MLTIIFIASNASNASHNENPPPMPSNPPSLEISKKVSLSFLRIPATPTVVQRSQPKSRPSIDKEAAEILPEVSPSTSGEASTNTSGNSGKSSAPGNNSTGKTSLDSKFNLPEKTASSSQSQHPTEKKANVKQPATEVLVEGSLTPIHEQEIIEIPPETIPSKFIFRCGLYPYAYRTHSRHNR
jgi:hypothetical protein